MLSSDNVYERLNRIFHDVLDDDAIVLSADTTAADVEGWDSMVNVQLMLGVEQEFGVHLSAGQMQALHNVGDLVNAIISRAA